MSHEWNEKMVERQVTYILEIEDRIIVIENVPARVNVETGERCFSPETVERLQQMIWEEGTPTRYIQTPIYQFAA